MFIFISPSQIATKIEIGHHKNNNNDKELCCNYIEINEEVMGYIYIRWPKNIKCVRFFHSLTERIAWGLINK